MLLLTGRQDGSVKWMVSRWGPVAIAMAVIYIGSEQPAVRRAPAKIEFAIAKISHVLEFAALGGALSRAIAPAEYPVPGHAVALSVAVSALYAASDEFHQIYTPGRTATVRDVVLDVIGALLGAVAYAQYDQSHSRQPVSGIY
jgi:VanZ family protein